MKADPEFFGLEMISCKPFTKGGWCWEEFSAHWASRRELIRINNLAVPRSPPAHQPPEAELHLRVAARRRRKYRAQRRDAPARRGTRIVRSQYERRSQRRSPMKANPRAPP